MPPYLEGASQTRGTHQGFCCLGKGELRADDALPGLLRLRGDLRHKVARPPSNKLTVPLRLPHEVDGSQGTFRAPRSSCTLRAGNDYEAVQAWLSLHETPETLSAYRKEAERLILWAVVDRGRALSSLTTEDAIAYRGFLRRPTPRERWVDRAGRARRWNGAPF